MDEAPVTRETGVASLATKSRSDRLRLLTRQAAQEFLREGPLKGMVRDILQENVAIVRNRWIYEQSYFNFLANYFDFIADRYEFPKASDLLFSQQPFESERKEENSSDIETNRQSLSEGASDDDVVAMCKGTLPEEWNWVDAHLAVTKDRTKNMPRDTPKIQRLGFSSFAYEGNYEALRLSVLSKHGSDVSGETADISEACGDVTAELAIYVAVQCLLRIDETILEDDSGERLARSLDRVLSASPEASRMFLRWLLDGSFITPKTVATFHRLNRQVRETDGELQEEMAEEQDEVPQALPFPLTKMVKRMRENKTIEFLRNVLIANASNTLRHSFNRLLASAAASVLRVDGIHTIMDVDQSARSQCAEDVFEEREDWQGRTVTAADHTREDDDIRLPPFYILRSEVAQLVWVMKRIISSKSIFLEWRGFPVFFSLLSRLLSLSPAVIRFFTVESNSIWQLVDVCLHDKSMAGVKYGDEMTKVSTGRSLNCYDSFYCFGCNNLF